MPITDTEFAIINSKVVNPRFAVRNKALFALFLETSLKPSRLVKLIVSDLWNSETKQMRERVAVMRDRKVRCVCLSENCIKLLRPYVEERKDDEFVFMSQMKTEALTFRGALKIINDAKKATGLNTTGSDKIERYKDTKPEKECFCGRPMVEEAGVSHDKSDYHTLFMRSFHNELSQDPDVDLAWRRAYMLIKGN